MRISDWSSDVCSSDLTSSPSRAKSRSNAVPSDTYSDGSTNWKKCDEAWAMPISRMVSQSRRRRSEESSVAVSAAEDMRSEEHTSELQSLMRISYAVFCLKKTTEQRTNKCTKA